MVGDKMREILFKGKRVDNGEWVEGFLFQTIEHTYIAYAEQFDDDLFLSPKNIFIEVIPETVRQYTGKELCDEKLFEGDIVEWYEDYDDFGYSRTAIELAVVVWDSENYCWAFKTDNEHVPLFCDWNWEDCFIIGNIHDNPELLKGEEEDE